MTSWRNPVNFTTDFILQYGINHLRIRPLSVLLLLSALLGACSNTSTKQAQQPVFSQAKQNLYVLYTLDTQCMDKTVLKKKAVELCGKSYSLDLNQDQTQRIQPQTISRKLHDNTDLSQTFKSNTCVTRARLDCGNSTTTHP